MARKKNTRLKAALAERGITYRELSAMTGIPMGSICPKMGGNAAFSSREAHLIRKALGIPEGDIFLYFRERVALRTSLRGSWPNFGDNTPCAP